MSSWQEYILDVEAIRAHPYYTGLQYTWVQHVIAFFRTQESAFLEFIFTFLVTVFCIWMKALLFAGIIWICYSQFFAAREGFPEDLEAGDAETEKFEEDYAEKEKGFVEMSSPPDS